MKEIVEGCKIEAKVSKQQPDATLDQDDPVSGQKYTLLDIITNVRIISIAVVVTWTVQPSLLEIHLTIDGQTITFSQVDPVSATDYSAYLSDWASETEQPLAEAQDSAAARAFLIEGRTVKIEAEITGGTVSNLSARVKYSKIA